MSRWTGAQEKKLKPAPDSPSLTGTGEEQEDDEAVEDRDDGGCERVDEMAQRLVELEQLHHSKHAHKSQ